MKKRPLCYLCLAFLMIKAVILLAGGAKFSPELRPSPIERSGFDGEHVLSEGKVYQKEEKETYQLIYLKHTSTVHSGQTFKESKLIIYDEDFMTCRIGNTVKVQGELGFFEVPGNPGNFDQHFYYQKQGIHASVWASKITVTDQRENLLWETLYQIRTYWRAVLYHAAGEKEGAVLSAVVLGEKGGMDQELKELYQKNGIGHILDISGLHISFLGLGLYHLLRKGGLSYGTAGGAAMAVLGLYIVMIGPGVSSIRAFTMLLIRVAADLTGRVYDMPTSIAVSAAGIIALHPLYLLDAGFLLSFGAVTGIAVVSPYIRLIFGRETKTKSGIGDKIADGLLSGVSIYLMTLPVMLFYFFEFPILAFVLNLIVVPLMSLLLILTLLGSAVSLLSLPIGGAVLIGCKWILKFYEWLCYAASAVPGSRIVTGRPGTVQMIGYYIGLSVIIGAGIYFDRKKRAGKICERQRKTAEKLLVLCMAGMMFLCTTGHGRQGEVAITAADVGQGDGIYARGPKGGRYLFDGGSSDVKHVGQYRLEPFLKSQGTGTLDYVFLSHGDADHMNGIEEMIERQKFGVRIRHLVLPQEKFWDEALLRISRRAEKAGIKVLQMKAGDKIQEQEMEITCLFPGDGFDGEKGNESSLVFQLEYKNFCMLLTGDVEGAGEEALAENKDLKNCQILKTAHHGSKNSTIPKILEQTQPQYAVISCGKNNRYGHPHKETIERLEKAGCEIRSTAVCGAVMIWTDGGKMTVETFRKLC